MNRALRLTTAVCLASTALFSVLWTLTQPEFLADPAAQLASLAEAGPTAAVSALGFLVSQLPFAVGMAGLAAWLYPVSPRLAVTGGVFALIGAFGHAVIGGAMVLQLLMADVPEHRDAYAVLIGDMESSPLLIPFFAAGLIGTVLGIMLLSIAHFRSRREPRWVGPVLWAFVLVEFVGSSLSEWATYLAMLLFVSALGALTVTLATQKAATSPPSSPSSRSESVSS